MNGVSKGSSAAVLLFGLVFAGCAAGSPAAAAFRAPQFADDSAASEEIEAFARCEWPLDASALKPRFAAAGGGLPIEDGPAALALAALLALGAAAMGADARELAEGAEDHAETGGAAVGATQGAPFPTCDPKPSRSSLALFSLGIAAALKVAPGHAPAMCQRAPVLVPRRLPLTTQGRQATEELRRLPGLQRRRPGLASDATAAASLLALGALGAAAACADAADLAKDEEERSARGPAGPSRCLVEVAPPSGDEKKVSWLPHLSMHWRLLTCVVLLLAVCGAAVTSVLENGT